MPKSTEQVWVAAETPSSGDPIKFPAGFLPVDDLSHRAQLANETERNPFAGVVEYEVVFNQMCRALHRRVGHHLLLVGERGVGKLTVVAELARRAFESEIPFLTNSRFLAVDCRFVLADDSRGRLLELFATFAGRPDVIVCLDNFASLLRSPFGNNYDLVGRTIACVKCSFIGLLTPAEFEEYLSQMPDLDEAFARIDIPEPHLAVAVRMVEQYSRGLEAAYQVTIAQEAIQQAVHLTASYVLNDQLPAKAVKVLRKICDDVNYDRVSGNGREAAISTADVTRAVSTISGIPEPTLQGIGDDIDYVRAISEQLVGQDHIVEAVSTELSLIKAGMTEPRKPASVMLFVGQTGTGKTELAKILARFYSRSKRLRIYTLGNCVEPHSVSTIIGVPPGYVGHDQGGRLVNELNARVPLATRCQ